MGMRSLRRTAGLAAAATLLALDCGAAPAGAPGIALTDCRLADLRGITAVAARCGTLEVPEDPDDPAGPTIGLAVAVVPAVSTRAQPDPLVLIAGGPGQAAREAWVGQLGAFSALRRERDIVLVDQRGTGGSNRLDCPFPGEELQAGTMEPEEIGRLARECLAALPGRPQFYTTSLAVRDLEAVRAALGYERLNLVGASYGTRVAQHYLRRYPERVRTVTLDSVVPPGLVLGPAIAIEAQRALDAIFARCAADPACSERFPDVAAGFGRLVAALRRAPVPATLADPVTGARRDLEVGLAQLVTMARMLSYSSEAASLLPLLVHEAAARGNYAPLAAQALMIGPELERMIAMGMHHSVVCSEDAPRFGGAVDRAALEASYIGDAMLEGIEAICAAWPRGPVDEDFHAPLDSPVPALLLSGGNDPATPVAYGEAAAAGFRDRLHVILPGQGHGQLGLACVQRFLRRFVESGSVADLDAGCAERFEPAPFFLDWAGPAP